MSSSNVTFGTYCRQRINKDSPIVLADKLNGCEPKRRGKNSSVIIKLPSVTLYCRGTNQEFSFLPTFSNMLSSDFFSLVVLLALRSTKK